MLLTDHHKPKLCRWRWKTKNFSLPWSSLIFSWLQSLPFKYVQGNSDYHNSMHLFLSDVSAHIVSLHCPFYLYIPSIKFLIMLLILGSGDWPISSFCFWKWEEEIHLPWRWEKRFLPNSEACRGRPCNAKEGLSAMGSHLQQPNAYQGWYPWMEWWRGACKDIASPYPMNLYWRNPMQWLQSVEVLNSSEKKCPAMPDEEHCQTLTVCL